MAVGLLALGSMLGMRLRMVFGVPGPSIFLTGWEIRSILGVMGEVDLRLRQRPTLYKSIGYHVNQP